MWPHYGFSRGFKRKTIYGQHINAHIIDHTTIIKMKQLHNWTVFTDF